MSQWIGILHRIVNQIYQHTESIVLKVCHLFQQSINCSFTNISGRSYPRQSQQGLNQSDVINKNTLLQYKTNCLPLKV